MIGTLDIKINAAHPNMPLSPVYTFIGSPQQVRVINVPKQIGNWKITAVQVTVNYPDNSSPSVEATLTGGCWSATLPAPSAAGQSLMGFKVTASGVDEHGDPITGYVLGKGDAYVLDDDATITVGGTTYYVHLVETTPEAPHMGDLDLSTMKLWNGSAWVSLGSDITLDDAVTETSANGVKSSGIWTWVKSLLPSWLTSNYAEPATVASVAEKYTKPSDGIPLSDLKPSTFPPSAHTHTQSDVTGLVEALDGKLDLTGGTITGNLKNGDVTWNNRTITYRDAWGRTGSISLPALGSSMSGSTFATKIQIDDAVSGKANKSDFTIGSFADYVSALFSIANTSLMGVVRYAFNSDGTLKDRAINAITYAGGALPNFPAQVSGYARDFLLNVTATATASDITLPESGATSVGDALAFEASHTYLVAITEIAAKHYYIRIIDTTPANA